MHSILEDWGVKPTGAKKLPAFSQPSRAMLSLPLEPGHQAWCWSLPLHKPPPGVYQAGRKLLSTLFVLGIIESMNKNIQHSNVWPILVKCRKYGCVSVYVCIIENTVLEPPGNQMDYRNSDSSNHRWVKTMVGYIFSKTNRYTKNSHKKPSQGLQAVSSSSCLLVLMLTFSVNLIPKVSQLSSFVVLSHIL